VEPELSYPLIMAGCQAIMLLPLDQCGLHVGELESIPFLLLLAISAVYYYFFPLLQVQG